MTKRDQAAEVLIRSNFEVSESTVEIIRFFAVDEDDRREPIKLLEVDENTIPSGRVDVFGFAGRGDVSYATALAMVTPEEWEKIQAGEIDLPDGWELRRSRSYRREANRAG